LEWHNRIVTPVMQGKTTVDYDLIIVGGGLAGSSLGAALAREGRHILIVEREAVFRDRVRGEGMLPWGADEAQKLGIYKILAESPSRAMVDCAGFQPGPP
jgi:2-polyprenyl-6-methoxyphenol hydroxylase-like FAD-dependent oxidoreductase